MIFDLIKIIIDMHKLTKFSFKKYRSIAKLFCKTTAIKEIPSQTNKTKSAFFLPFSLFAMSAILCASKEESE